MQGAPNDNINVNVNGNGNVTLRGNRHDTEAVLDITLSEHGARALLQHFPNVETLYIRYRRYDSDEDDDAEDANNINNDRQRRRAAVALVTDDSIVSMFTILGDHKKLSHLVIDNMSEMQEEDREFPLRALTGFVQKARQLVSLHLDVDAAITGTSDDGRAFLESLQQHPSLTHMEVGDFGNEHSTIMASDFSPLMVPNKWEELTISHTGEQVTGQHVDIAILQSRVLRKLLIDTGANNGRGGFQPHLPTLFEALRTNQCTISTLTILDDLHLAEACALMIQHNTTLNHIFLSLGIQSKNGALITAALLANTNITSLRLIMSAERNGDASALVHNLRNNTTLKRVHFHFQGLFNQERVDEVMLKPFAEILEDNYVLEEIQIDKCHGLFDLSPKVQFFLELNRAGRKKLLESMINSSDPAEARALWTDKVIQHRTNLDVVFYFLSQNPSFLPGAVPG
jgi:hypothetical protein